MDMMKATDGLCVEASTSAVPRSAQLARKITGCEDYLNSVTAQTASVKAQLKEAKAELAVVQKAEESRAAYLQAQNAYTAECRHQNVLNQAVRVLAKLLNEEDGVTLASLPNQEQAILAAFIQERIKTLAAVLETPVEPKLEDFQ